MKAIGAHNYLDATHSCTHIERMTASSESERICSYRTTFVEGSSRRPFWIDLASEAASDGAEGHTRYIVLCQPMAALEDCTNLVGKVQVRARALGSSPLLTVFERLTRVLLALSVCWPSRVLASRQFRRAIAAAGVA